ncbi:hypothetical protein OF83DRAFT_1170405 [Amylostereum chailletii]|nr:hypothetical protein OF83DRAFT_1170405 [Amylostereum chailletii]
MFKRVDRRLRRKEEEEQLGINEEMKEVMGLNDTDSSESESESDSSTDSDSGVGSGSGEQSNSDTPVGGSILKKALGKSLKRKRVQVEDAEETDQESADEEPSSEEVEEGEEDEDEGVSIASALREPIHVVSLDPDIRACVFCPGKSLKNPRMIEVHESSKHHQRRLKRAQELSMGLDPEEDIRTVLSQLGDEKSPSVAPQTESKRAAKRKAKQAAIKQKKEKEKAKKAAGIKLKKEKKLQAANDDATSTEANRDRHPSPTDINDKKAPKARHQKSAITAPPNPSHSKKSALEGGREVKKRRKTNGGEEPKKASKASSRMHSAPRYFDGKQKAEPDRDGEKSRRRNGKEVHTKEDVLRIFD